MGLNRALVHLTPKGSVSHLGIRSLSFLGAAFSNVGSWHPSLFRSHKCNTLVDDSSDCIYPVGIDRQAGLGYGMGGMREQSVFEWLAKEDTP